LQAPLNSWEAWGADACDRYRALLVDQSTFASAAVEELLDADVLPDRTTTALRDRYLPG
jgi:hypothetical protein